MEAPETFDLEKKIDWLCQTQYKKDRDESIWMAIYELMHAIQELKNKK